MSATAMKGPLITTSKTPSLYPSVLIEPSPQVAQSCCKETAATVVVRMVVGPASTPSSGASAAASPSLVGPASSDPSPFGGKGASTPPSGVSLASSRPWMGSPHAKSAHAGITATAKHLNTCVRTREVFQLF